MKFIALLIILAVSSQPIYADQFQAKLLLLEADDFESREIAHKSLLKRLNESPYEASEVLAAHYARTNSPESKSRIRAILKTSILELRVVSDKYGGLRGFVGISMEPRMKVVDGVDRGVVRVRSISPGSPAHFCGLKEGDQIYKVDEQLLGRTGLLAVTSFGDYVGGKKPGETVLLNVYRENVKYEFKVQLAARYLQLLKMERSFSPKLEAERLLALEKSRYFEEWLSDKLKE